MNRDLKQDITLIVNSLTPMSAKSLDRIIAETQLVTVERNSTFITKGKMDSSEYFLLSGICRSFLLSPEGEEITIQFYNEGNILSPFVTRTKKGISNLNFQTLTDTTLGIIDAKIFEGLMVDDLEIRGFGNEVLKRELEKKVQKEIGLASLTASERLENFRKDFAGFENQVPHSAIATYLGITNVSLSRLRKNS